MTDEKNETLTDKRSASGLNSLASETLPLLKKIISKKGMLTVDVVLFWEQIVGQELSLYTRPEKITFKNNERNNGTLYVAVPNGAFALELQHREKFILDKVNSFFGYQAVSSMRIRQSVSPLMVKKCYLNQSISQKKLVSTDEQNYIEQITQTINSENLRKQLKCLAESVLSENHKKEQE